MTVSPSHSSRFRVTNVLQWIGVATRFFSVVCDDLLQRRKDDKEPRSHQVGCGGFETTVIEIREWIYCDLYINH